MNFSVLLPTGFHQKVLEGLEKATFVNYSDKKQVIYSVIAIATGYFASVQNTTEVALRLLAMVAVRVVRPLAGDQFGSSLTLDKLHAAALATLSQTLGVIATLLSPLSGCSDNLQTQKLLGNFKPKRAVNEGIEVLKTVKFKSGDVLCATVSEGEEPKFYRLGLAAQFILMFKENAVKDRAEDVYPIGRKALDAYAGDDKEKLERKLNKIYEMIPFCKRTTMAVESGMDKVRNYFNSHKETAKGYAIKGLNAVAGEAGGAGVIHATAAVKAEKNSTKVVHILNAGYCFAMECMTRAVESLPFYKDARDLNKATNLAYGNPNSVLD